MGIASLILGIISLIIGFIPLCGAIALLPAIIGIILGIVDTVQKSKKNEKKGISIAGLVLSSIATVIIIFWVFVFGVGAAASLENEISKNTFNSLYSGYDYEYDDYDFDYDD